jgi:hypothetical protein
VRGPRFTEADAQRAFDEWGCNCGPGALAAVMGMTLDEVRPYLNGFDEKRYTNPLMMYGALRSIGRPWKRLTLSGEFEDGAWPCFGLARIQWEGPWTEPGVPIRARYRQTHWVGAMRSHRGVGIWDINALNNGSGWCSLEDWTRVLVPAITAQYKRASGAWHITHSIEAGAPIA